MQFDCVGASSSADEAEGKGDVKSGDGQSLDTTSIDSFLGTAVMKSRLRTSFPRRSGAQGHRSSAERVKKCYLNTYQSEVADVRNYVRLQNASPSTFKSFSTLRRFLHPKSKTRMFLCTLSKASSGFHSIVSFNEPTL
ncbi:hypothetical protein L596_000483 [Steinernema carpocapsae]|uniref:Uncharacterized protein n=1 Tax=Steinernema carpocapsae TaxID=34508 RepID=A0A4U8UIB3_STECR|nr:hypothetical protein L596_000483 [Steinernema carpocapsae]